MNLSFKNRIAFYYTLSTATIVAVVFLVIYFIVKATVIYHLNNDLNIEVKKHSSELTIVNDSLVFKDEAEWMEREHRTIEVNPVFVQVIDSDGNLISKSPNLKEGVLVYDDEKEEGKFFNSQLSGKSIRQIQASIDMDGEIFGYLLIAMSLEDSQMVLTNLKKVLGFAFPIVLIILFLVARLIASRSIKPVSDVIQTANKITKENLSERINIPLYKDELYTLVVTINDLLERIENAVKREKQFTSDASHELRTPLAVLKGTLEVLIRKPRDKKEYLEKISYSINEIDRLNHLVDQLLLLARFDSQNEAMDHKIFDLVELLENVVYRFQHKISEKKLKVNIDVNQQIEINSDPYMLDIILENLISNAVKYSYRDSIINIIFKKDCEDTICEVTDNGVGIRQEELLRIFERFYRSDSLSNPDVDGNGLGLSIVKRMCDLLKIDIKIESQIKKGTSVKLIFKE